MVSSTQYGQCECGGLQRARGRRSATRTVRLVVRKRMVWILGLVAVCAIAFASPVAAQNPAGIIGQVKDSTGAILPGVTVAATSPALQVPQATAVTDENGEFRITPLPIGVYTVVFELPGFQSVKLDDVRLTVGFTARLDQQLSLGSVQETITVSGTSPLIDVTSSVTSTEKTAEQLEALPTSRDGLKAYMAQVPGVVTNFEVGSSSLTSTVQFKVYGQTGKSWQMLEGILMSAPWGDGNFGSHIDFGSIEGTRVETVGTNAEMPRRGMLVDTVLKSGGNNYHGNFVFYGSSHQLEANNIDDELRAQGVKGAAKIHNLVDVSANLGGRIIRDKLWFFGAARRQGFDRDTTDAFFPDGTPVPVETNMPYYVGKLSYQMTPSQKMSGIYHYAAEQLVRGAGALTPIESRQIVDVPATVMGVTYQATRGSSLVFTAEFGQHKHLATYEGMAPGVVATTDVVTQRVSGDNTADGRRWLNMRRHAKGVVSWYKPDWHGNHEFKSGVDYLFSRVSDERLSRRSGNYQLVFSDGSPFQLNTYNYHVKPTNDGQYLGVYLQDSWTLGRRVTVNAGFRFAHDNAYAPAQCREAADFAPATCYPEIQMRVWNSVVPRLHASWDIAGDGRTVLKGGFGRFDHLREISPEVTNTNRLNATTSTWDWRDLNGNRNYDAGEVNLDPNGPDFRSISGVTDAVPNPDEKQPRQDEWSMTLERQLMTNWAVRGSGIYTKNFNVTRLVETSRPYSLYGIAISQTDPGPDNIRGNADDPGRTLTYYEYPASLSGRQFAGTMAVNDPRADYTYKTIEVALARRLVQGWQFQTSFTATLQDVPFGTNLQPYNPNTEINTALHNWERVYKASGSYVLPWEVLASVNYTRLRGAPQARQVLLSGGATIRTLVVNAEALGSLRLPSTDLLDLRLGKRVSMGASRSLEFRADIFNLLNINTVVSRQLRSGSTFLQPSQVAAGSTTQPIVLPRIMHLGVTFSF